MSKEFNQQRAEGLARKAKCLGITYPDTLELLRQAWIIMDREYKELIRKEKANV